MFCLLVEGECQLNSNYSVNILSECLRILIGCSQLSKTYYNVFSFPPEIVMHDAYIADVQRITLNASCVTISDGRTEQLDIIAGFSVASLALPVTFSVS